MGKIGIWI